MMIDWCKACGSMVHPEVRSHKARIRWRCFRCFPPGTPASQRGRGVEVESEEVSDEIFVAYELARDADVVALIDRLPIPFMTRTWFYAEWQGAVEDSAADFPC